MGSSEVIFLCNQCLRAVEVITDGPGGVLVGEEDRYTCPWCSTGKLVSHKVLGQTVREDPQRFQMTVMMAEDFYRAARGMGLPGEYGATPGLVTEHFRYGQAVRMDVEGVGDPLKTVVHSITLKTPAGTFKLYFGSGTQGAVIYRIKDVTDERRPPATRTQAGPDSALPGNSTGGGTPADGFHDCVPGVRAAGDVQT